MTIPAGVTPWVIEFYNDSCGVKQAAVFATEKTARNTIQTCHEHPAVRVLITDDRGFEIRLFPERFSIVLIPPSTVAAQQHAAAQEAPGGVVVPNSTQQ